MPQYVDKSSIDADDDFISAAGESNSSSEDEWQGSTVCMLHRWSCHISILCFSTCIYFYVLCNPDTSMSGLPSDLETEENNGTILTAKNGTKWKKTQVSDQSTGRLEGYNILTQCPGPTSYMHRNIQVGSPANPWNLFIDKLRNTSGSAPSLKLHCCYVRARGNRIR